MLRERTARRRTNAPRRGQWGHVPEQGEILMTVRLYGLWALSIVLVLIVEVLTPGRFTLLPVPW